MQTVTPSCARPAESLEERPQLARNIEAYLRHMKAREDGLHAKLEEKRVRIRELETQVLELCRGVPQRCASCGTPWAGTEAGAR